MNNFSIISTGFILIGLLISLSSYWGWKKLYANNFINDEIVSNRQRFRTIGIWGMLLAMAGYDNLKYSLDETSISSFIFVGIVMGGYSRIIFEPYFKASIAKDLTHFCLYLRPFYIDTQSVLKNKKGFVRGMFGFPETMEKHLCKRLNEQIAQTFAIGNPNSNLPTTFSTTNLYANNEEWKETIASLAKNAKVIIVRIGETEGCLWEVAHCIKNSLLNKTIFLVDEAGKLDIIKEEIEKVLPLDPLLSNSNNSRYALFLDGNCKKWIKTPMYSKADTKLVLNRFINSHGNLSQRLKNQQKENGVFKSSHSMGSTPSKFWQILSLTTNPIAYCLFNRWPKRWWITLIIYSLTVITLALNLGFSCIEEEMDEDSEMAFLAFVIAFVWSFLMLPWLWIAPRVSWRCGNWGSRHVFSKANRSLALWLTAYSLTAIVIFLFQLFGM